MADFGTSGQSVDPTSQCFQLILILHCIPNTVKIAVANLKVLQLGINSGELLVQGVPSVVWTVIRQQP